MRKKPAFLAVFLLILILLAGCSSNKKVCTAVVEEVSGGAMFVRPVEGSSELLSSDLFSVSLEYLPETPRPGDTVRITYSGYILELYPSLFDKVSRIDLVPD